jgi:hypothetical protein
LNLSDLVAQGDVPFGQGLKAAVIIHVLPDLADLVLGNALGDLFALEEALQDKIRAEFGGGLGFGAEELLAEATAAEAVDGLHVSEDSLALLKELIEIGFHLTLLYHCRYNTQGQNPPACLLFDFGLLYGHTPISHLPLLFDLRALA